jgi:PAS domain S-box-containing protein
MEVRFQLLTTPSLGARRLTMLQTKSVLERHAPTMVTPISCANEASRLASLRSLGVLDTPPEAEFDALVRAAAAVCDVPVSLISLVDVDRQWFKANYGLAGATETPREIAFCAQTVARGDLFEVEDAAAHPMFTGNPLVIGEPHIRFYAGAPVRLADGAVVGTLCVIDRRPRRLDPQQREVLKQLAVAAAQALEGRRAVAEMRMASEALAESEARFRTLSEHAPLGVFHTDASGFCTYTNPRWQQIYGLSLDQGLGEGWTKTLHPSDKDLVWRTWQAAAVAGRDFDMEFRILRADREVRTVRGQARAVEDVAGGISGYVGSVEDVTRRKQLEAFLDRTGRLAGVGGWELDLGTNSLTWSDQTKRIHEVAQDHTPTVEEAIDSYAPEAREVISRAVQAGIDHAQPWDLELPLTTAAGRSIWVRTLGEAEFEGGKAVRLIGAIKDITETRLRSMELQREHTLRMQVEHHAAETERLLAERSQMLDILAHEVRQPLNNASAALQSAAGALSTVDDQAAAPRLSRAQSVLSQVLSSIDNTLAVASLLARPDPIERDDTDIDALLAVTIADMPPAERDRVRIERSTSLRTASMDMSLLRLALRNLLSNALRYSAAGTAVVLHLADSDEPLALLIDVGDEGPGLPATSLPRLFERGSHRNAGGESALVPKRENTGQGLGLGLYIVRRVMELHGGTVSVLRNSPQGVTMRLTIVQPLGD